MGQELSHRRPTFLVDERESDRREETLRGSGSFFSRALDTLQDAA
jgi:hypothetical protein